MRWKSPPLYLILKRLAILAIGALTLVQCGQNYNSNSNDGGGDIGIDCTANARLCAAYTAIQSNHCFECHGWSSYKTDAAWEGAGLVVAGSTAGSQLITKLKNSGGDMPQNYGAISNDDYSALVSWIQNL
jgi:hypothetical protein